MGQGIKKSLLLCTMLGLAACGGGGGDDDDTPNTNPGTPDLVDGTPAPVEPADARVVRISVSNPVIPVGGAAQLSVEPTFAESRVEAGERVVIVVKLPAGVGYQEDSSGVQTTSGSAGASPFVNACGDGSSLLTYDLGSTALNDAEDPDGAEDADARLILGIEGLNNTGAAPIQAAAADNALAASCDGDFDSEAEVEVVVQ